MWSLIALAAARSSAQSASSATAPARLALMVPVARERLPRSWGSASAPAAASGKDRHAEVGGHAHPALPGPARLARISARCMVVTAARCRRSPPPMCIRQELSAAHSTCGPGAGHGGALVRAHGRGHVRVLHRERAAEAAAHVGVRELGQVETAHRAQQPERGIADPQHAQRVAARVVGDPEREAGADVGHPEHVGEQDGQLVDAGHEVVHRAGQAGVPRLGGEPGMVLAHHRGAGGRRGDDRVELPESRREPAHQRQGLVPVPGVEEQLPAAGLLPSGRRPGGQAVQARTPPTCPSAGTACR